MYLGGLFRANRELPLYTKYSPHLCIGPMIESLRFTQELIDRSPDIIRPEHSQPFVTKSYCERKVRKLAVFEDMSTRNRRKLSSWMKIAISSLVPKVQQDPNLQLMDQVISNEIHATTLNLVENTPDLPIFFNSIRKIVLKIAGNAFHPKIFSRERGKQDWFMVLIIYLGLKIFKILPLYTYQQRFIPISSNSLQTLLNSCKRSHLKAPKTGYDSKKWCWKLFNFYKIKITTRQKLLDKNFNGTFSTDGVSICFHFNRPKSDEEDGMHLEPIDQSANQPANQPDDSVIIAEPEVDDSMQVDDPEVDSMQVDDPVFMGLRIPQLDGEYDMDYSFLHDDQEMQEEESDEFQPSSSKRSKKGRTTKAAAKPKATKPKTTKPKATKKAKEDKVDAKAIADKKFSKKFGGLPPDKKQKEGPKLFKAKPLFEKNTRFIGLDPGNRDMFTAVDGMDQNRHQVWTYSSDEHYHNSYHHIMTQRRVNRKKKQHRQHYQHYLQPQHVLALPLIGPIPPSIQEIETYTPTPKTSNHEEFALHCRYASPSSLVSNVIDMSSTTMND